MARRRFSIQVVTSFEMMAMMVVAGLGVGISAHSRITQAQAWGICLRPLADGPYEVVALLCSGPPDISILRQSDSYRGCFGWPRTPESGRTATCVTGSPCFLGHLPRRHFEPADARFA